MGISGAQLCGLADSHFPRPFPPSLLVYRANCSAFKFDEERVRKSATRSGERAERGC